MNRTTNLTGIPVPSDAHSQSIGPDGAISITDHYLIEKLAHFNRERVPERVVHAKGGGAFGTFTVTNPEIAHYTKAALFQPRTRTRMLARFSTVAGESGSPDTWRDPRGFALKFYTTEGNYDLVCNNTPIFFIRDGIKFPDFIHSQKRLPGSHLRDADMQWDFWTQSPESAHQVTWLMGDRGIPKTWRHMNGYGSHTYQWVNATGERYWIKYHFITTQGVRNLTNDEAIALAGQDSDHHLRDLYTAISDNNHPSWELNVQIMPYEDAKTYRFNPFDLTKVWPHSDYPLQPVGIMTLTENPENYFAHIEQAAFAPSNFVPGIGPSPDKMLQARIFSYADAHRYRIGANYTQLPVNTPAVPVHAYNQNGAMRYHHNPADMAPYAPNSTCGPTADTSIFQPGGWEASWQHDPELTLTAHTLHSDDDDFGQARTLYQDVFDKAAKARFLDTLVAAVGGVQNPKIRTNALLYWANVDAKLSQALETRLNAGDTGTPDRAASQSELTNRDTGSQ